MAGKQTASGRKKLTKAQKQLYREKGIIPDDWWNYGINPVLGYRNYQMIKHRIVENSHPVPKSVSKHVETLHRNV